MLRRLAYKGAADSEEKRKFKMIKHAILNLSILLVILSPSLGQAQTATDADFNGDGKIDFTDFVIFAQNFGKVSPRVDVDNSGKVDFADFIFFASVFGQSVGSASNQGQVTFYNYENATTSRLFVNDMFVDTLISSPIGASSITDIGCGAENSENSGYFTATLPAGIHSYRATDSYGTTLEGQFAVEAGQCTWFRLQFYPSPDLPPIPSEGASFDIDGIVVDAFGIPVASAEVALLQDGTELQRVATGSDGTYTFDLVGGSSPRLTYLLRASKDGFDPTEQSVSVGLVPTQAGTFYPGFEIQLKQQSLPVSAVIGTQVERLSGTQATLTIDVFVVNSDATPVTNLSASDFEVEFTGEGVARHTYSLRSARYTFSPSTSQHHFSAVLLMDQSGSIELTDPNNARLQAARIFLNTVKPSSGADMVLLSAFASDGELGHDIVRYHDFTSDGASLFQAVENLAKLEGGGTPLYRAIQTLTPIVANESEKSGSLAALVVFTDGDNTAFGVTLEEAIETARSRSVRVYMVGLGTETNRSIIARIAEETGGAVMWAKDPKQLVAVYGSLGSLLRQRADFYTTTWDVTSTSSFASGMWFAPRIKIQLPDQTLESPFFYRIP